MCLPSGVVSEIMALDQSLLQDVLDALDEEKRAHPPTAFIHMPKDVYRAKQVHLSTTTLENKVGRWWGVVWWGVVGRGVVWCGAVLCGVVWCGVVRCGVVRCGAVRCGAVRCGAVRCGVVWCGVVWCGVVVVWCGVVWCGVSPLPLLTQRTHVH
jgi:hypothetical protein